VDPVDYHRQAHYLAGGNVPLVIRSIIAAKKAKTIDLSFKLATAIDLAGRNVLEAVQTSVYPKVIDCPPRGAARESLDAVAKNGIQLKVKARVTVRANLNQLIGGATEETIIARVGEGIVSAIGSADSHMQVLENPDRISKAVLARRPENRRAMAVAQEQEMIAGMEESRAKVVEAEAEVPKAIAKAFREGNLGIMDYYKLRNVQADTDLRKSIVGLAKQAAKPQANRVGWKLHV
jgi:uncharacterized protein YqfA (UPF0365 family)